MGRLLSAQGRLRLAAQALVPMLVLAAGMVVAPAGLAAEPAASVGLAAKPTGPEDLVPKNPFEAPSAAGVTYLMEQAGLLNRAPAGPTPRPRAVPAQPAQVVDDVLVNNPANDTPERTTQSETSLAVQGNTICAGYNDSGTGGFSGLSRSTNLGATWTDLGGLGASGDPALAVHEATSTFYYAEIGGVAGNGIGVTASTDGCQTFGTPADAAAATSALAATTLSDKPWIAVDNTGGTNDGNIYACWTRFIDTSSPPNGTADTSELRVSRSTNGGTSFTTEQVISAQGTAPFGCHVAVGPNGQVYLAWANRAGANANDIRFASSTNAGVNYSAPVSIATGNRHPGTDTMVTCDVNRPTLTGNIRMLHQAWLAVDSTGGPFNGNIYAVYASDPTGVPDNSNVFLVRSTNGGGTWSAPVQLGTGGGNTDQFEPFVAIAGAGAVSVAWYDRRNDPTNNTLIDVYKVFSSDGGANFGSLIRVTNTNFGVPPINPNFDPGVVRCYMGEYIAVAGDDHNFYYLWGDNRTTLTTTNFPNGRPDPDVRFESEQAPIVNTADLRVEKSDSPDPVVAGTNLTYTITVTNGGPDIALEAIATDTLPAGVTYLSDTGSCDTSALPVLTCNLGDLANGASASFSVTVKVSADLVFKAGGPTTLTDTVSVTGVANDPDASNNTDAETTSVVAKADLAIVSFQPVNPPSQILVGKDVTITLRKVITNHGPSAPMDVKLTKTASAPGATITPASVTELQPALGLGELRTVDEDFTVRCNKASSHTFTFTNEIAPANPADTDPDLSNNTAQVQFQMQCVVPVAINIKPGSFPNSINLRGNRVPVAVLTTAAGEYGLPLAFDATKIDPGSVRFGPADLVFSGLGGAPAIRNRGHIEDAFELDERTKDGDKDMVLHFHQAASGLAVGDTQACVKGDWTDSGGNVHSFFGCDSVRIVH